MASSFSSSSAASPTPSPTSASETKYFLLHYEYVDQMLERRGPVRPMHLAHAKAAMASNLFIMGGAHPPDAKTATIVLKGTKEDSEAFARNDPYVLNKLVMNWSLQEWTVVLGIDAVMPKQ